MPPKKGDPFNFDAEFLKAGATGFVKQSMAEMKQAAKPAPTSGATAKPSPVSSGISGGQPVSNGLHPSPKPQAQQQPQAAQLPAGSLDFLDGLSKSGAAKQQLKAAAPGAPKVTSHADPFHEFGSFSSSSTASAPAPAPAPARSQASGQSAGGADPFAMFDDVVGVQAVQPATVTPTSAQDDGFLAFDDAPAPFTAPSSQQEPVKHTAYPAVPSATSTLSPSIGSGMHVSRSQGTLPPADSPAISAQKAQQQARSALPVSRAPATSPKPVVAAVPQARTGGSGAQGDGYVSRTAGNVDAQRSWSPASDRPRPHAQQDRGYSQSQGSSSAAVESKGGAAGGGVMGMLKGFTQKAVKAAQAGLQQLENALERMDDKATSASAQREGYAPSDAPEHSNSAYDPYRRSSSQSAQQDDVEKASRGRYETAKPEPESEEDDPGAVALTILALPQEERGRALALLKPRQRNQVEAILKQLTAGETPSPALSVDIKTSAVDLATFDSPRQAAQPAPAQVPGATSSGSMTFDEPPPDFGSFQHAAPQAAAATSTRPQPATSPVVEHHDLLGMSPKASQPHKPAQATFDASFPAPSQVPAAAMAADEDLLGMHVGGTGPAPTTAATTAAQSTPSTAHHSAVVDVDDMHDFFSSPATASIATGAGSSAGRPASAAGASGRAAPVSQTRPAAPVSPLMDLHAAWGDEADTSSYTDLYEKNEGEEGEPELRRQLRAARLAEKHAKMRAALASKLAAEAEEARQREEQVSLKEGLKAAVDVWKNKNKGNIRGLLGSLQNVLWENSGWQSVGVGDLLEPAQIRKVWMKANLLVHPDKVRQRNGSPEQVARADMIFDVLKDAWNMFQSTGR